MTSAQDRKDLDKFVRFLALKSVQIIVQSRLGEKVKTKSKPHSSGSDWFNVLIKDMPEVLSETKKAMAGQIPSLGLSLCVEISLRTVEGDSLVLETWSLGMTEQCDPSVRIMYTVYNRMSILLKSLLCVTRVTPAYKLSCRQGQDSYVICYRVYVGEPQLQHLGDAQVAAKIGEVVTPLGTVNLKVSYRTQMTISQSNSSRDCAFMVKSDHFKTDFSPKWNRIKSNALGIQNSTTSDEMMVASSAEDSNRWPVTASPCSAPKDGITTPCNVLYVNSPINSPVTTPNSIRRPSGETIQAQAQTGGDRHLTYSEYRTKVGAFGGIQSQSPPGAFVAPFANMRPLRHDRSNTPDRPDAEVTSSNMEDVTSPSSQSSSVAPQEFIIPELPLSSIFDRPLCTTSTSCAEMRSCDENDAADALGDPGLKMAMQQGESEDERGQAADEARSGSAAAGKPMSSCSDPSMFVSVAEDFVFVDAKPPFSCSDDMTSDLGAFYRECQFAPTLASLTETSISLDEKDLDDQLAAFETSQVDFDDFVSSLCQSISLRV